LENKKAYLYWIHLSEHTLQEGYVGVSTNPKKRFNQHRWQSQIQNHRNPHLQSAIGKYGEKLSLTVLEYSDKETCYEREAELRPDRNIGWNIATGGQGGDVLSDEQKEELKKKYTGSSQSEETKKKRSETFKKKWNTGWKGCKGFTHSDEWKENRSKLIKEQYDKGKRTPVWQDKKRPDHSAKMKEYWRKKKENEI
jgi:predicted GIY-YIG superfamily endonuclease